MIKPKPIRTDRLRRPERPFSWIPFRILTGGYLKALSPPAKLFYFFLCLVADRNGVSFYGERRLTSVLGLAPESLVQARTELCTKDMIAFDGKLYQVLSLPPASDREEPKRKKGSPESIRQILERIQQGGL